MSDTQWPRYEVFKKDNDRKTHEAVGSVHAPDAEIALLNGRDVFVRRPSAVSLWVAAERDILSMTAEELAADPNWHQEQLADETPTASYHIFTKSSQRRSMTFVKHIGDVTAQSAKQALKLALEDERFEPESVFTWWVVPETAVTRSEEISESGVIESWFEPAKDKKYRQQSHYGFVGPRKKLRQRRRSKN